MQAYQKLLPILAEKNATLMAISPMTPDKSLTMAEKNALEFPVLSDVGNRVARDWRLVFRLPEYLDDVFKQFGFGLPEYNGDESWELPIPGTFVVDRDRRIRLASVDADYTTRLEPRELVACLNRIG